MEIAIFIIKPDGIKNSYDIKNIILRADLKIIFTKKIALKKKFIDLIYPQLNSDIREASYSFLCDGFSEVGIIEGQNANKILKQIAGKSTNPSKCEIGTIRNLYGEKKAIKVGKSFYFKNVIHRSDNKTKAKHELGLIISMLNVKEKNEILKILQNKSTRIK